MIVMFNGRKVKILGIAHPNENSPYDSYIGSAHYLSNGQGLSDQDLEDISLSIDSFEIIKKDHEEYIQCLAKSIGDY